MTYLTISRARTAGRIAIADRHERFAASELRNAAAAPLSEAFDVFLSHAFLDAIVILGVKALLEADGVRVYVDWIEDKQLDRSRVNAQTADLLRKRMRKSKSFIFATSQNSPASKWMPWELGFFDGYRAGHVAILPLVADSASGFSGQEYLGLYPHFEEVEFTDTTQRFAVVSASGRFGTSVSDFARSGVAA